MRKNFVALNVPMQNLATYSVVAKHHYFPDAGSRNPVGSTQRRRHRCVHPAHRTFDEAANNHAVTSVPRRIPERACTYAAHGRS